MRLIPLSAQPDLTLENPNLSLIERQRFQELLIAGAVDDAGDAEFGLVGVPVYADVFFAGAGEGEVDYVGVGGGEDVGCRGEYGGVFGGWGGGGGGGVFGNELGDERGDFVDVEGGDGPGGPVAKPAGGAAVMMWATMTAAKGEAGAEGVLVRGWVVVFWILRCGWGRSAVVRRERGGGRGWATRRARVRVVGVEEWVVGPCGLELGDPVPKGVLLVEVA